VPSRAESHWLLLGAAFAVSLLAALVSAYLAVMVPLVALDRFALAALVIPTVWVLVCLHVLLSTRPARSGLGYVVVSMVLFVAGFALQAWG
jgi:hypothetical protein